MNINLYDVSVLTKSQHKNGIRSLLANRTGQKWNSQAGAELGKVQLKQGLDFIFIF